MPREKTTNTAGTGKGPEGRPAGHKRDLPCSQACHFGCGENLPECPGHHSRVPDRGSERWVSCGSCCANLKLVLFLTVPFGSDWSGLEDEGVQPWVPRVDGGSEAGMKMAMYGWPSQGSMGDQAVWGETEGQHSLESL